MESTEQLLQQIASFIPKDQTEENNKQIFLQAIKATPDTILTRENQQWHLTSSGFILNPELDKALMVFHNIYQSLSWTGGHADGDPDLLSVSIREAMEETGLQKVWPLRREILSLDVLPVKEHQKHGKNIAAHRHLSVAYGLIATEDQLLQYNPAENSQVLWIAVSELAERCTEKNMLPLYEKLISRMRQQITDKQNILSAMVQPLLTWYGEYARQLPWRQNPTPYWVWLSEIMLQQTRVEAVKPYFAAFTKELPTVEALANVDEERLMKLWQGLGYYNRARNLQKAAQMIMTEHNGVFPSDYASLLALPGVGEYTAGAIASIAFGAPEPAVDGNVLRVVARLTEDFRDIAKAKTKQHVTNLLRKVYPQERCGDLTQALMELGAMVCLPNGQPKCSKCPLQQLCLAYQHGSIEDLPIKAKKKPRKQQQKTVAVLVCGDKIAIHKRGKKGLLAGLWEFPNFEGRFTPQQLTDKLKLQGVSIIGLQQSTETVHVFTHIEWHMIGYRMNCAATGGNYVWVSKKDLEKLYSLPSAFRTFYAMLDEN